MLQLLYLFHFESVESIIIYLFYLLHFIFHFRYSRGAGYLFATEFS